MATSVSHPSDHILQYHTLLIKATQNAQHHKTITLELYLSSGCRCPPHSRESKPLPPAAHTHTHTHRGARAPGAAAHISQVPLGYCSLVYATTGLLFSLCKPQYSKNELHKIPIIPVLIHIFRCFCSAIPPSTDALCIEHLDMNKTWAVKAASPVLRLLGGPAFSHVSRTQPRAWRKMSKENSTFPQGVHSQLTQGVPSHTCSPAPTSRESTEQHHCTQGKYDAQCFMCFSTPLHFLHLLLILR